MKLEACKTGTPVVYFIYSGGPGFRGIVRDEPFQLGHGAWVVHLHQMEPAYCNGEKSSVTAALVRDLQLDDSQGENKAQLRHLVFTLLSYAPDSGMPDYVIEYGKKETYYEPGDELAPFFSEAFLYSLMGKEEARTILAMVNSVIKAAGIDPRDPELVKELNASHLERIAAHEKIIQRRSEITQRRLNTTKNKTKKS